MKIVINNIKKQCTFKRIISKSFAIGGGLLIGFTIFNWFGLIIGAIIGFFTETIITKAFQKNPLITK